MPHTLTCADGPIGGGQRCSHIKHGRSGIQGQRADLNDLRGRGRKWHATKEPQYLLIAAINNGTSLASAVRDCNGLAPQARTPRVAVRRCQTCRYRSRAARWRREPWNGYKGFGPCCTARTRRPCGGSFVEVGCPRLGVL